MQELDFVRKRFMLDLDDKQAADKYGHNTLDDIPLRMFASPTPSCVALHCVACYERHLISLMCDWTTSMHSHTHAHARTHAGSSS